MFRLCRSHVCAFQIDKYTTYVMLKHKLLARTPALRTSLATQVRAEIPRPLAPGELPAFSANWRQTDGE